MPQHTTDNNGLSPLQRRSRWLADYRLQTRFTEYGRVVSVGDGIAWLAGLPSAGLEDMLLFDDGSQAMVFDLTEDLLGAVLLHQSPGLTAGTPVRLAGHRPRIAVGQPLLGRVVDPLGLPLDGGAVPDTPHQRPLFAPSPPIIARERVTRPLYTGSKVLDTLLPVGKGQRQLLVGDEGLGRSALAIDAVINQRGRDVLCVYVLSGQKRSSVVNTITTLKAAGAMAYTAVVVAEASALPGLQHLAPFAGCALAEYWMQQGRDTLVIYDDLSNHARIYRELSLLLRRPPGREAYPGDIFSIHAQLLERTTCLNAGHGGGSMTALPIVETQQGEIAAYIPTNLISITDGQAYLDAQLFAAGFRPAIDIPRSVSRIGGQAQHPVIKKEAGRMKLDYLQFLELEVFTRFGTKLEASMEKAISRGRTLRELLKQERLAPHSPAFQVAWLKAFNQGLFEPVPLPQISAALRALAAKVTAAGIDLDSQPEAWQALLANWRARLPLSPSNESSGNALPGDPSSQAGERAS